MGWPHYFWLLISVTVFSYYSCFFHQLHFSYVFCKLLLINLQTENAYHQQSELFPCQISSESRLPVILPPPPKKKYTNNILLNECKSHDYFGIWLHHQCIGSLRLFFKTKLQEQLKVNSHQAKISSVEVNPEMIWQIFENYSLKNIRDKTTSYDIPGIHRKQFIASLKNCLISHKTCKYSCNQNWTVT